jgi:AraC family transcriptional regulator
VFDDGAASLTLSLYPPLLRQPPHRHERPSVTFLLSGSVEERVGSGCGGGGRGALGRKAEDLRHSNVYGPDGAILLTLSLADPVLWQAQSEEGWCWNPVAEAIRPLATAALSRRLPFEELVTEMLAFSRRRPAERRAPPAWLAETRARLWHSPDLPLAELARDAGVHRVHLSRSYSRWFGESLSLFRLRRRTEIGLTTMLHEGASPADSAAAAGFADQSHFARSVKRTIGATPGALRAMLA